MQVLGTLSCPQGFLPTFLFTLPNWSTAPNISFGYGRKYRWCFKCANMQWLISLDSSSPFHWCALVLIWRTHCSGYPQPQCTPAHNAAFLRCISPCAQWHSNRQEVFFALITPLITLVQNAVMGAFWGPSHTYAQQHSNGGLEPFNLSASSVYRTWSISPPLIIVFWREQWHITRETLVKYVFIFGGSRSDGSVKYSLYLLF